jgi:hypothetical protein
MARPDLAPALFPQASAARPAGERSVLHDATKLLPNVAASMRRRLTALPARGAFELQEVLVLLALIGVAYAAGYYTRDRISRRRRERAREWANVMDPERPQAANTNQAPAEAAHGDLAQMLNRWKDRARVRRSNR